VPLRWAALQTQIGKVKMQKQPTGAMLLCALFSTIACGLSSVAAPVPTLPITPFGAPPGITAQPSTSIPTVVPTTPPPTSANCANSPAPHLTVGMTARVLPGITANVRSQPSTGAAPVTTIPSGDEVEVVNGPVCADGYEWWQVKLGPTQ